MTSSEEKALYAKKWRQENAERVKAYGKKYYAENRDKVKARIKRNPEAQKIYAQRWELHNTEKSKASRLAWWERNKAKLKAERSAKTRAGEMKPEWRRQSLLKKYGIRVHEYEALLASQNGLCAVCGGVNKTGGLLHVDHCHTTGVIRGLLCIHCNMGIGQFRDSPDLMRKAIAYVEQHKRDAAEDLPKAA